MLDKVLLAPYRWILRLRHALYDQGIWKSYPCEVPTICVGNITAGGTGKTPHTEMILDVLRQSGEWGGRNLAVLSRGYKSSGSGFREVLPDSSAGVCGDEALQIKKHYPDVTVAVDRNRVEGCRILCHPDAAVPERKERGRQDGKFPAADLIVLDDAFQYRTLRAHINIVLVDWNRPVDKDRLLPLGGLRDLPERMDKADMIIVTKCPLYMDERERACRVEALGISSYDPKTCEGRNREGGSVMVFFSRIRYMDLEPVFPDMTDRRFTYSKKLILFTGIAKDTPLRMYLSDRFRIVRRFSFSDHHKYSATDIGRIMKAAGKQPTAVIVSTEKDVQRVLDCGQIPEALRQRLFQIPIKVEFLSDAEKEAFTSSLLQKLREFRSESVPTPRGSR